MHRLLASLFLLSSACYGTHAESPLNVYHRLYHPIHAPNSQFVLRGALTPNAHTYDLVPSSGADNVGQFQDDFKEITNGGRLSEALYQVALQRKGDTSESHWDVKSVKACHLTPQSTATLTVHVSSTLEPFAIDHFISPIPHDGSCPKESKKKTKELYTTINSALSVLTGNGLNTTIIISHSHTPPLAELRTPPPLSPEGQPVQPIPEKTFFQKYWYYILGIVIALLISSGPEEGQKSAK